MITLALDTTGSWCTCAVVSSDRVLADPSEKIGRGHAESLAPMVAKALELSQKPPEKIERISVTTGPGSFTGLRVALAFARSFALPRKIPVIGISALQAMAAEADPAQNKIVIAAINAKRGDICWAVYKAGQEIRPPRTMPADKARRAIEKIKSDHRVGDGLGPMGLGSSPIDHVSGPVLGWMADNLEPVDFPPEPLYARGPDAKLPGGKSLL